MHETVERAKNLLRESESEILEFLNAVKSCAGPVLLKKSFYERIIRNWDKDDFVHERYCSITILFRRSKNGKTRKKIFDWYKGYDSGEMYSIWEYKNTVSGYSYNYNLSSELFGGGICFVFDTSTGTMGVKSEKIRAGIFRGGDLVQNKKMSASFPLKKWKSHSDELRCMFENATGKRKKKRIA